MQRAPTPASATDQAGIRRLVRSRFGQHTGYVVVSIPSHGMLADRVFVAQSAVFGPSRTAARLARILTEAATHNTVVVVTGSNPAKVARVLLDAVRSLPEGMSPRILWIAPHRYAETARRMKEKYGASISIYWWPDNQLRPSPTP